MHREAQMEPNLQCPTINRDSGLDPNGGALTESPILIWLDDSRRNGITQFILMGEQNLGRSDLVEEALRCANTQLKL